MSAVDQFEHFRCQFAIPILDQALVDRCHAVDAGGGGNEIMADHDNGDARAQGREQIEQAEFAVGIDVGGWFVKEEQTGIGHQSSGYEHALFLPTGQSIEAAGGKVDHIDQAQAFHGLVLFCGRIAGPAPTSPKTTPIAQPKKHCVEYGNGKTRLYHGMLRHIADGRARGCRVSPKHADFSVLGAEQAENQFDQGGLAAAVWAYNGHEISDMNGQIDVGENVLAVVGKGDALQRDDRIIVVRYREEARFRDAGQAVPGATGAWMV